MTEYQRKDITAYHILKTVESDASISQRRLSSQMDINVASVNFALKRLIKKGLVRMVGMNPRRIKYFVTPKGLREKTKLAYKFFGRNFHFYKEVRNDIEAQIKKANGKAEGKIAIYGINELAEIAYMAVMIMKLDFTGFFIDDSEITNKEIFGHKVHKLEFINKADPSLLLITESTSKDLILGRKIKKIDTLDLLKYYKY